MENVKPRKKSNKKKKIYFGVDVENAIIEFNKSDDRARKNELWNNDIRPAFSNLVNNLINIYRVYNTGDSVEVVSHDTISFLYDILPKYDKSRGKAFSLFNTAAKNFVIQKAQAARKYDLTYQSLDMYGGSNFLDSLEQKGENEELVEFIDFLAGELEVWIPKRFKKVEDRRIALDIVYLIKKYSDLDIHNRKEVFVFVREMTNSNSKKIASILSVLRKKYEKIKREYYSG